MTLPFWLLIPLVLFAAIGAALTVFLGWCLWQAEKAIESIFQ